MLLRAECGVYQRLLWTVKVDNSGMAMIESTHRLCLDEPGLYCEVACCGKGESRGVCVLSTTSGDWPALALCARNGGASKM